MRRLLAVVLALSVAHGAHAQAPMLNPKPPGWVLKGAQVDCDFLNQRYYNCPPDIAFQNTRASTANQVAGNGIWYSFANNAMRITDGGFRSEGAATNFALWSRDLTQVATWVAVTMNTALNATGLDGTANSASTITASAGNGTLLQAVASLTSTVYRYSFWAKRSVGSGNFQYSVDNGSTWTNCVVNTTTWTACGKDTASGTAFTFGFRLVTNTDAVIIDGIQLETSLGAGIFGSSTPIFTTSATVARSADVLTFNGTPLDLMKNKVQSLVLGMMWAGLPSSGSRTITGSTDSIFTWNNATSEKYFATICNTLGSGGNANVISNALPGVRIGGSTDGSTTGGSCVGNNSAVSNMAASIGSNTAFGLGNASGGGSNIDATFLRLTLWARKIDDAALATATCLTGNC